MFDDQLSKFFSLHQRINKFLQWQRWCYSALFSLLAFNLWVYLHSNQVWQSYVLLALAFVLFYKLFERKKTNVNAIDVKLYLDISEQKSPSAIPEDFAKNLLTTLQKRVTAFSLSIVIPSAVFVATLFINLDAYRMHVEHFRRYLISFQVGATLEVKSGSASGEDSTQYELSRFEKNEVKLHQKNLVEIQVLWDPGRTKTAPVLELYLDKGEEPGELYQSFQLIEDEAAGVTGLRNYKISFSAQKDVNLKIPAYAGDVVLAKLFVRKAPIPDVSLMLNANTEEPWADELELPITVEVSAKNPIKEVKLLIKTGKVEAEETIFNVISEDKHHISSPYEVLLENYVQQDYSTVELTAVAVDRTLPTPLVGYSDTVVIETISAYGRYRKSLESFKNVKSIIDENLESFKFSNQKEVSEHLDMGRKIAEKSPFFDGMDRAEIFQFSELVISAHQNKSFDALSDASERINYFLFDHEILDDRERDRDFFVAARSLSRLISEDSGVGSEKIEYALDRLKAFVVERRVRWKLRIDRLEPPPPSWEKIRSEQPFLSNLEKIKSLERFEDSSKKTAQLDLLSKTVGSYRDWLDELEKQEDENRTNAEKKKNEGLANARDVLRELQKRQDSISKALDRADERKKEDIDKNWSGVRFKQNTNYVETKKLEGQLRSLSPVAGVRLAAAVERMKVVIDDGAEGEYVTAETASDESVRLLRLADNAARESQKRRKSRGRRRRVTGDSYHGQHVIGGDIEIQRDYEVDRRYREDILEEILKGDYSRDDKDYIQSYLRKIIR